MFLKVKLTYCHVYHFQILAPSFGDTVQCVNFMQGKHRDRAIYERKLVWNQHFHEHDSPGASLWSIIYILERAKKLNLKFHFFCIFSFIFYLKRRFLYWVFMLMLVINVKWKEEYGSGKSGGDQREKRGKAPERWWDARLRRYHADWACRERVLLLPNSSSASCRSLAAVPRMQNPGEKSCQLEGN